MFPGGRDKERHSFSGRRPVPNKEEVARAALRSLAEPSASSALTDPPPLPHPSLPAPSFSAPPLPLPLSSPTGQFRERTRPTFDDHDRHNDRQGFIDGKSSNARRSFTENVARPREDSPSFFQDQRMIASPDSSPKTATRSTLSTLPPVSSHLYARRSLPAFPTTSRDVHETALRRASLALGVNVEEVRQIVSHAYGSRRTSNPVSVASASASASSQGHLLPSSVPDHESVFVRQVLDAYYLESDRASHQQSTQEARRIGSYPEHETAASSGTAWHHPSRSSTQPSQPQQPHFQADHGSTVAWGTKTDQQLPTFDARGHNSTFRTAYPAHHDSRRFEAAATTSAPATSFPFTEQRSESPSPFAYDPYRRTPQPASQEYNYSNASSSRMRTRASHGYLDERAYSRAFGEERSGAARTRHSRSSFSQQQAHASHSSAYERRVRSIDDYLEQQQQQQQQQHRQRRRGTIAYHPSFTSGDVFEYEDDRFFEGLSRPSVRHSFQPYPPTNTRQTAGHLGGGASHPSRSQSPQLSPTMPNLWRFQQSSQLRSPRLRSPTAETVTSVASSSVASIAALTPSPLLGTAGSASNTLTPDERRRGSGAETDAQSSLRGVSEDAAAETTRVGVARMQIDGASSFVGARASSRKVQSTRSSSSDRGSAPIAGTDLTHSEIMQKLQDKVKSRLAAKGKAAAVAEHASTNHGKQKNASNVGANSTSSGNSAADSSVRAARLARGNSHKRSAASIGKLESSTRSSAAPPISSRRSSESSNVVSVDPSATAKDGSPAPKVRRTSAATSQQRAASKPASPSSKSEETPASIEAALLSPTDTPTPANAAANRAELLSISPRSPQGAVETASGQALPGELPGANQMNASSASKQQTSMAGIDSLLQAAQATDPTETNSVIA